MDDMWSVDELGSFVPTTSCLTPTEGAYDGGWEGDEKHRAKVAHRTMPKLCARKPTFP